MLTYGGKDKGKDIAREQQFAQFKSKQLYNSFSQTDDTPINLGFSQTDDTLFILGFSQTDDTPFNLKCIVYTNVNRDCKVLFKELVLITEINL